MSKGETQDTGTHTQKKQQQQEESSLRFIFHYSITSPDSQIEDVMLNVIIGGFLWPCAECIIDVLLPI